MSNKYRKERREKDRRAKRWLGEPLHHEPPPHDPRYSRGQRHDRDRGPDRSADRGRQPGRRNDHTRPDRSWQKVDVYGFIRKDDPTSPALGIWNGKSTRQNPRTGEEEERYAWIRRDRVEIKQNGGTGRSAGRSVLTIVEWLAEDWEFDRA